MYKIDRRGGGPGGPINRSLGQTEVLLMIFLPGGGGPELNI